MPGGINIYTLSSYPPPKTYPPLPGGGESAVSRSKSDHEKRANFGHFPNPSLDTKVVVNFVSGNTKFDVTKLDVSEHQNWCPILVFPNIKPGQIWGLETQVWGLRKLGFGWDRSNLVLDRAQLGLGVTPNPCWVWEPNPTVLCVATQPELGLEFFSKPNSGWAAHTTRIRTLVRIGWGVVVFVLFVFTDRHPHTTTFFFRNGNKSCVTETTSGLRNCF